MEDYMLGGKAVSTQERYNGVFPTRLRELIRERKTTITAVARELGVSRQAVSQYQDGSTQPDVSKLLKIAAYFGVSVDYLVGLSNVQSFDTDLQAVCRKYLGEGDEKCGGHAGLSEPVIANWGKEGQKERPDYVNHPPHYTSGGVECVDAIEAALAAQSDPVSAWLTGQVIKYLWRFPQKNGVEDLEKARWYLDRLLRRKKEAAT